MKWKEQKEKALNELEEKPQIKEFVVDFESVVVEAKDWNEAWRIAESMITNGDIKISDVFKNS